MGCTEGKVNELFLRRANRALCRMLQLCYAETAVFICYSYMTFSLHLHDGSVTEKILLYREISSDGVGCGVGWGV